MWPSQHHFSITGFEGADALFVSALQRSQAPTTDQVRQAINAAGDHPETAAARMRWARETLAGLAFGVRLAA
jgi:hypothetical protein